MGDLGSIPRLGRLPGGGHGNPLQYSFLENPEGQRSLAGVSPGGHKGSGMTEPLNIAHTVPTEHILSRIRESLFYSFFFFPLCSMQDLGTLTKMHPYPEHWEMGVSTSGPPGKSSLLCLNQDVVRGLPQGSTG